MASSKTPATLPSIVRVGEVIFLENPKTHSLTGLYAVQFKKDNMATQVEISRNSADAVNFKAPPLQNGPNEVTGLYPEGSVIAEPHLGRTEIIASREKFRIRP